VSAVFVLLFVFVFFVLNTLLLQNSFSSLSQRLTVGVNHNSPPATNTIIPCTATESQKGRRVFHEASQMLVGRDSAGRDFFF